MIMFDAFKGLKIRGKSQRFERMGCDSGGLCREIKDPTFSSNSENLPGLSACALGN